MTITPSPQHSIHMHMLSHPSPFVKLAGATSHGPHRCKMRFLSIRLWNTLSALSAIISVANQENGRSPKLIDHTRSRMHRFAITMTRLGQCQCHSHSGCATAALHKSIVNISKQHPQMALTCFNIRPQITSGRKMTVGTRIRRSPVTAAFATAPGSRA